MCKGPTGLFAPTPPPPSLHPQQYAYQPLDYDATFTTVRQALLDAVFGPPKEGVYSPSVQYTL
jgi:hypothetical protein